MLGLAHLKQRPLSGIMMDRTHRRIQPQHIAGQVVDSNQPQTQLALDPVPDIQGTQGAQPDG